MNPDDKATPNAIAWQLAACCDQILAQSRRMIAQHRERLETEEVDDETREMYDAAVAELDAFEKSIEETALAREAFQPHLDALRASRGL